MESRNKRSFMSDPQKKLLLECVRADEELMRGKFSSNFTQKIAKNKWEQISILLNSTPGAQKSAGQWERTWQDLKKSAKKKNAEVRKYSSGTGGGPVKVLTDDDKAVLDTIEPTSIIGDPEIPDFVEDITCNEIEVISQESTSADGSLPYPKEANGTTASESLSFSEEKRAGTLDGNQEAKVTTGTTSGQKNKRILKNRNLENFIESADRLIALASHKETVKEEYYAKKLQMKREYYKELLAIKRDKNHEIKEKTLALNRIAAALENSFG